MRSKALLILLLLSIGLVNAQKNFSFVGNLSYPFILNDVWGHVDTAGNEYAIVGTTAGTSIVNVSTPASPQELFFIAGPHSIWRDMKTWDNFAYVVNETDGGLLIIDLNYLPDSIYYERVILTGDFRTAHNLFVDENGIVYLFGSNVLNQGALMFDLKTANRFAPEFLGAYDDRYVHDGFVRGDTLWTSEIMHGDFSAIDVSNRTNTTIMARIPTSGRFTHNCWLSDDGNYLITTDEIEGGAVDIYDVSNLNNIRRLDSYRSNPGDSSTPHNTFFLGDYIYTAYYRDGVTLVDAHKKDNLVEVGNYDTSPLSGGGFEGAWGVYPYLPSGNILVSDREEGLFVVAPTYTRASYLEGTVTNSENGFPINNMRVELMGTQYSKFSTFNGSYKNGAADAGFYDVRFYHPNCKTVIVPNVELIEGQVTELNISTTCDFTVSVFSEEIIYDVEMYPNPVNERLNIWIEKPSELKSFHIFDLNGALVHREETIFDKTISIDLNNWYSGVYLAKFSFSNQVIFKKIIKN
jgi:choice-of-anchor B domain-containing protein